MKGISVVIATYKRREQLITLLNSIVQNKVSCVEAIIADQNTDGLIDDIIEEYSQLIDIKHLKIKEPNQSKARNIGAEHAKYPVVCFPDDDCWYEPDTLQKIIQHFEDESYQTDLLIINWKQHPIQLPTSSPVKRHALFSFRGVGYGTIVLYFKTEVFKQLGGFNENIGIGKYIGGGEDSELTYRAMSKKMNLYYSREICINHLYNPIITRELSVIRTRQRAMGYLYAKYNIPYWIVLKGITAPFVKMIWSMSSDSKRKQFYNMYRARVEGLFYGLRNKENRFSDTLSSFQHRMMGYKAKHPA